MLALGQHDHRVLAAELERAADQAGGGLLGDELAGRGRAGEADVVGALDDRRADDRAGAADDLPDVGGEAGLAHQLDAGQRDQRALAVGLVHDRVASGDGRDAVGDRHGQRVVPRADQPDDALGLRGDRDAGEQRQRAVAALGLELLVEPTGVEASRQGDVRDLVEGVRAALARLDLDQVEQLVLVLEHEVVQAKERLLALTQRRLGPRLLGRTSGSECRLDVVDARDRDLGDGLAVERRDRRTRLARGGPDQRGELGNPLRGDERRRGSWCGFSNRHKGEHTAGMAASACSLRRRASRPSSRSWSTPGGQANRPEPTWTMYSLSTSFCRPASERWIWTNCFSGSRW